MSIEVTGVSRLYGAHRALDNVSLTVQDGELLALLGPSGSGKTTLLRVMAGLEQADAGSVNFFGQDARQQSLRQRNVGFVFQHYALFRHMTVFENVAFGLRVKPRRDRPPRREITRRVQELLGLVQLDGLAQRHPSQLSGGQRQRVALARALAIRPRVLLLDEPFGALDAQVRRELRQWLRKLHDDIGLTSVFVTHDQEEALELADRVAVVHRGRIEQIGTPQEVYHRPQTPFVVSFLGSVNLFHGRIEQGRPVLHDNDGRPTTRIFVRPHDFEVSSQHGPDSVPAILELANTAGPLARLQLRDTKGRAIAVELSLERFRVMRLARGDQLYLTPTQAQVFAT
ncbi:MAG: TOBE-like domain-containing protein [Planctomycetes bacterium]|nr:TOBE-like domain-containing protein [Planctomycetota bacterium]